MSYNPGIGFSSEYRGPPPPPPHNYQEGYRGYRGNEGYSGPPHYNTGSTNYYYSETYPGASCNRDYNRGYHDNPSYHDNLNPGYHDNCSNVPITEYNSWHTPPIIEENYLISDTIPARKKAWGSGGNAERAEKKRLIITGSNFKNHSAARKHPLMALKEVVPSVTYEEVTRERNDEYKFYRLVAACKVNKVRFEGEGVTMKIAKAEAAIRALKYLGVNDMDKMLSHVLPAYEEKQEVMKSVEPERYLSHDPLSELGHDAIFEEADIPTPDTHPVMYLHQLYGPRIEVVCEEEHPGFRPLTFTCTITVQGQSFQAQGPSKKSAQQITSALILERFKTHPPPVVNNQPKMKKRRKQKRTGDKCRPSQYTVQKSLPIISSITH